MPNSNVLPDSSYWQASRGAALFRADHEAQDQPDWCHVCGEREPNKRFVYYSSFSNAEHARLNPKKKHKVENRRVCEDCVRLMVGLL